jgi:integrase
MNRTVRETLEKIEGREGFVFRRKNGEPFKDSTVRKPFSKALKKSGIEDFRRHDMRHCFASSLVMAGVPSERGQGAVRTGRSQDDFKVFAPVHDRQDPRSQRLG